MSTFNFKKISTALIFTTAALVSVNANAADEKSIETVINQFVVEQSQQVVNELSKQIELSFTKSMESLADSFTFDQAFVWLASDAPLAADVKITELSTVKTNNQIEE